MHDTDLALLSGLIFLVALLYSSVGHGGASGYIAAMALFGIAPAVMRPTALVLNVLVASMGTYRLHRAGLVNWQALFRLAAASIPLAFIGGMIQLPGDWYRTLVGLVLAAAAIRLFIDPREARPLQPAVTPPLLPALVTGGGIGLLSGLTGVGGGIFLSPFLVLFGWAGARQTSGITAPFILVNSLAGLAGNIVAVRSLPPELVYFSAAALLGALIGTQLAIRLLSPQVLLRILAAVLIIAAVKFVFL
ncbi:MAG TPA: sulfite exporter TauE/SafE family protein [Burkholderiales bacterium]|nr:sulfite exporter TauE/SafE family protein [Burkholderiales bacterium]